MNMKYLFNRRVLQQVQLYYQVRNAGHWNKDWKPGDQPMTQEQYEAAAKKYNIVSEEYEPYSEGKGLEPGDYPKLPGISVMNKDLYYPWDMPDERRNFGEPLHTHAIFYGEERGDNMARQKLKYSPFTMFLALSGSVLVLYLICFDPVKFFPPVAARQYPRAGTTHYTYEQPEQD